MYIQCIYCSSIHLSHQQTTNPCVHGAAGFRPQLQIYHICTVPYTKYAILQFLCILSVVETGQTVSLRYKKMTSTKISTVVFQWPFLFVPSQFGNCATFCICRVQSGYGWVITGLGPWLDKNFQINLV